MIIHFHRVTLRRQPAKQRSRFSKRRFRQVEADARHLRVFWPLFSQAIKKYIVIHVGGFIEDAGESGPCCALHLNWYW